FSSRRRHTRSKRDWSSDVCSSDLNQSCVLAINGVKMSWRMIAKVDSDNDAIKPADFRHGEPQLVIFRRFQSTRHLNIFLYRHSRSEERRVGKECRFQ